MFYLYIPYRLSIRTNTNAKFRNAIESSRCTFQIRYITDFHISLLPVCFSTLGVSLNISVCVFFCVYIFFAIFSDWKWSEVQWVKCAKCAHARFVCCVVVCLLVEMSSRSLQCHFIRERSKFEMANKMMMSCLMMHSHAANVRTNKCAGARASSHITAHLSIFVGRGSFTFIDNES